MASHGSISRFDGSTRGHKGTFFTLLYFSLLFFSLLFFTFLYFTLLCFWDREESKRRHLFDRASEHLDRVFETVQRSFLIKQLSCDSTQGFA